MSAAVGPWLHVFWSSSPQAALVDGVHLVCIVITMRHISPVLHGPPVFRVVGGRVSMTRTFHTAEDCLALVPGHSGQVEPQLFQKVTRPEVIGVGV